MLPFLRKKPAAAVGVEINADDVKLLVLSHTASGYQVDNYAVLPLPPGAMADDKMKRFDEVQTVLRHVVREAAADGLSATIALPTSRVMTRRIKLAACLSAFECEVEISANLSRYFPGITAPLWFDFVMLPASDKDFHDIWLVAARAEDVKAYAALVSGAGLDVRRVDLDALAWWRGAQLSLPNDFNKPDAVIALCHVGRTVTQLMVLQRYPLLTQQWHNASCQDTAGFVREVLSRFVTAQPALTIDCLLLSGVSRPWQTPFDFPVYLANPFQHLRQRLDVSESPHASQLQLCCGLAMRSLQ